MTPKEHAEQFAKMIEEHAKEIERETGLKVWVVRYASGGCEVEVKETAKEGGAA